MSLAAQVRLVRIGLSEEYAPAQLLLAALVGVAPSAFFGCLVLGGGGLSWWWLVLGPVVFIAAARPDSAWHLVIWGLLLALWFGVVPRPFTWWSVPAALVVAVSHTALTILGGRPTFGDLALGTWPRVRGRLGVVGGATVGVAVVAELASALQTRGQAVLVVAALVVVSVWLWWGNRSLRQSDP